MMITGHGGSMNTGRNTFRYFHTISAYPVDAIEVDVWKWKKTLFLSHILPKLPVKRAIKLEFVFDFCKKYNVKVNCDVKWAGLVKPVVELAKKMCATRYLIFTGAVTPADIEHLTEGEAYVNTSFYSKKYPLSIENLPKIKAYLDSFHNDHIAGINIPYRYASNEFIAKAKEVGLPLSIYTVDDKRVLSRLIPLNVANITTNIPDVALELKKDGGAW